MPTRAPSPLAPALLALTAVLAVVVGVPPAPAGAEDGVGHLPTAEDFVTQQYEDFLGRSPDEAGLGYWAELVRGGIEPSAVVESMALSPEFEGTIAPLVRLYFAFFGRPPDYDGLTYWVGQIRNGVTLEQIAQQFVLSGEFTSNYGSVGDGPYVDLVYGNVLGRPADGGGRSYWTGQLGDGLSRGGMMVAFSDSAEYRRVVGPKVLATMLYVGMLRRAPDGAGLDYWAEVIDDGTPYRDIIKGFLGAAEYGGRMARIYDETEPLTGIATRAVPDRPALAVKIDNVDAARPQANIDRADVVYEEMVEGRLTRLIAVFHSDLPPVVGPVRSVRTSDIDVLDQLNTPLLAASGANPGVLAVVGASDVVNLNALVAGSAYYRYSGKRAPHNLYLRTAELYQAADGRGGVPPRLFVHRARRTTPVGGATGRGVTIDFGAARIGFAWSGTERGWVRTQNGRVHVTTAGVRLAPENVVVLEIAYGVSSIDAQSPEAHTVGSGRAWIFTAGKMIEGRWNRSRSDVPIAIENLNGDPVGLTPGRTFVELAPTGSVTITS